MPILAPVMARMAEQDVTIRDQAETIGRQSAELERAASIAVKLSDELEALKAAGTSTVTPGGIGAHETASGSQCPVGAYCGRCGRSGWR